MKNIELNQIIVSLIGTEKLTVSEIHGSITNPERNHYRLPDFTEEEKEIIEAFINLVKDKEPKNPSQLWEQ